MQTTPGSSPPDFDFNLPCRFFKSSFARSLSMHGGGADAVDGNDMQCKSLDFDIGQYRKISAFHNNNSSSSSSSTNLDIDTIQLECPPLPQRRQSTTTTTTTSITTAKNEAINTDNHNSNNTNNNIAYLVSNASDDVVEEDVKPPAIPARCPIVAKSKSAGALNVQHRRSQQHLFEFEFRRLTFGENANTSGNAVVGVATTAAATHGDFNRPINHSTQQQQQQHQPHFIGSCNANNTNNNDDDNKKVGCRCSLSNRRNVWPTDRDASQQQQGDNLSFNATVDMNGSADGDCAATPAPPVAARRATLTPHYAATTSTSVTAPRATPPDIERSGTNAFKAHSDNSAITANVQVVLLQNQVDTLQWQLKQVETGKEMYRAVIEEVARFLDRYQTQRQQQHQVQQQQQISRSKSLYQVYDGSSNGQDTEQNASGDKSATTTSCLRARSTTNPNVDQKQSANNSSKTSRAKMEHDAINPSPNNPYTTFKDFTWRRSPRKYAESKALAAANEVEEKLNQEAFRLSRTIQNLLNTSTQQPDLTQHRNALIARSNGAQSKVTKTPLLPPPTNPAPPTIIPKLIMPAQSNANKKHIANVEADKCNSLAVPADSSLATATAEMLFLRANVIRDSRLSLRSSTDSSVHSTTSNSSAVSSSSSSAASTTSSKVETDEDISPHHPFHPIALPNKQHQHPLSSATEDESGFSSISSFHDVGVPLSSTMISNRMSLPNVKFGTANCAKVTVTASDVSDNNETSNSRNSTLKANHPSNVLGLPLQAAHDMQHRWDTTTKTSYRNANTYQRFSTLSNEDAAAVLWV